MTINPAPQVPAPSIETTGPPSVASLWLAGVERLYFRGAAFMGAGLLLEWLWLALTSAQVANVWELQWGTAWLLPAVSVMAAALTGLWSLWLVTWLRPTHARRGPLLAELVATAAAAACGYGLTFGRHFEQLPRRLGFIALLALTTFALLHWVRPRLVRSITSAPRALLALGLVAALGLELVNRFVLVHLYPAFHWALWALTAGALVFSARVTLPHGNRAPRTQRWLGFAVPFVSVAVLPFAAARLARFDNFRWALLEEAPLLARAVLLSGWVAPPAPPAPAEESNTPAESPRGPSGQWEGRDLLLISVDALRADHVGAYGYARPTTPQLDALAASGTRFEYAYCATPHTSYSLTSLMTGKYIRPLLLQGAGQDSDTWATLLRTYGYRTAAFYPPAVFFVDPERFGSFEQSNLGFEYQKKEFLEGAARVEQVESYLAAQPSDQRLFVWVHLFGPHEPYEAHPEADFGPRDIDRYDSEIRAADTTIGGLTRAFRKSRPNSVVIVTADHGEEFGEHGGRYHGSSVFEEQVRVPLVVNAAVAPTSETAAEPPQSQPTEKVAFAQARLVSEPVQTIDLLPTVLSALNVPLRPRIRGRDLNALIHPPQGTQAPAKPGEGFAYAETDEHTLLAEGSLRLVCLRRLGACKLFNLAEDPGQQRDIAAREPTTVARLRARVQALNSGHGRFEDQGLLAEGKHWPAPLVRGLAGDGDAAADIGALLEDADVAIRREAASVLMHLRRPEAASALRLAAQRDEDVTVRRFAALALTRLGEGAPLTLELLRGPDPAFRRWAALALAENGDDQGSDELVNWWVAQPERDYALARDLLAAFAKIRCKRAVPFLLMALDDVRLRPEIAATLARIGESSARGPLALRLREEPYQTARVALASAIVELGGDVELVAPLRRWLAVPDPLPGGVGLALRAEIAEHLGGPKTSEARALQKNADVGEVTRIVIPGGPKDAPLRLLLRAKNPTAVVGQVRIGPPERGSRAVVSERGNHRLPVLAAGRYHVFEVPPGDAVELTALVPADFGWYAGLSTDVVVYASGGTRVEGFLVLPAQEELPRPAAKPPAGAPGKAAASTFEAPTAAPNR